MTSPALLAIRLLHAAALGMLVVAAQGVDAQPVLLKDIDTLPMSTATGAGYATVGGTTYFAMSSPLEGTELWKSDGTSAGTAQVVSLTPGLGSSNIANLTAFDGKVYFTVAGGSFGTASLYSSDGTAVGTVRIGTFSTIAGIRVIGPSLFFTDDGGAAFKGIWRLDAGAGAPVRVGNFSGDSAVSPRIDSLAFLGATLYFSYSPTTTGRELYRLDAGGLPQLVVEVRPGASDGVNGEVAVSGGKLLFAGNDNDPTVGYELWASDGTAGGTALLVDTFPGVVSVGNPNSGIPQFFRTINGRCLFLAWNGNSPNFYHLWTSDGTVGGTFDVAGATVHNVSIPVDLGTGLAVFTTGGDTLRTWTGTGGTTTVTTTGAALMTNLAGGGGRVFFQAQTAGEGRELWMWPGSGAATRITDLNPGTGDSNPGNSGGLGVLPSGAVYIATAGIASGTQLYAVQPGTATPGPTLVYATGSTAPATPVPGPDFRYRALANGKVVFTASDGAGTASVPKAGTELWATDGTTANTLMLDDYSPGALSPANNSFFDFGAEMGGFFYYVVHRNSGGNYAIKRTDGTPAGTSLVKALPSSYSVMLGMTGAIAGGSSKAYFLFRNASFVPELWVSDGTGTGTVSIKTFGNPVGSSLNLLSTTVLGDVLFLRLSVQDNTLGTQHDELWRSDGTAIGTVKFADISDQGAGTFADDRNLSIFGGKVVFVGRDAVDGFELWSTDGVAAPARVTSIRAGAADAQISGLTVSGTVLSFLANDGATGLEPWTFDGTTASLLCDINPGIDPSFAGAFTAIGTTVFLSANGGYNTPSSDNELYRVDGGVATKIDIDPAGNSSPTDLHVMGGKLYCIAGTAARGREWYEYDPSGPGTLRALDEVTPGVGGIANSTAATANAIYFTGTDATAAAEPWIIRNTNTNPNQAPVVSAPASASATEDQGLTIAAITVSDADAGAGAVLTTITVPNGVVTLATTAGLAFATGDGTADDSMSFTSTIAALNAALAGITYRGDANYFGADTIGITVDDQGNTGGAARVGSATIAVTVANDNADLPVISAIAPDPATIAEDAVTTQVATFTVSDADQAPATLTVAIVGDSNPGLFSPAPTIQGSGGTRALAVTPAPNQSGSALLTVRLTDAQGNFAESTVTVNVTAVNDLPTISGATSLALQHDATQSVNLTIGDVETAAGSLTLSASSGNPGLLPVANVVFVGGGVARTAQITPVPGQSGVAVITITVTDGGAGTANLVLTVTVNADPTITPVADHDVNEDAVDNVLFTVGDDATAVGTLSVGVASSNQAVVPNAGLVLGGSGANRTLQITPLANVSGVATVTITVTDSSGGSATEPFILTVDAVNDVPVFTKGADQTVVPGAAAQTVVGWATGIVRGAPDESAQILDFQVTASDPSLFAVVPAIAANGTLTYTPGAIDGVATVTVRIHDDGGTANGGVALSAPQTFLITIASPVNDAPSFTKGADRTVLEDAGAQSTVGWATAISPGPIDEAGQNVDFIVTNGNNALFSVQPTISPTGTLTFTPAADANGAATVTVRIHDDGGTLNSGVDTSAPQTFLITVTAVNDPPTLAAIAGATVLEDAPTQTVLLAGIGAGAANEAQTLTISTSSSNTGLIAAPAVTYASPGATGTVTYAPVANASGSAVLTVTVSDGVATTVRTFTVTVTAVNDAPVATDQSVTVVKDVPTTASVVAIDVDGDALAFSVVSGPAHGTLSAIAGTTVTYTPSAGYTGPDSFTYKANDGTVDSNIATIAITVAEPEAGSASAGGDFFSVAAKGCGVGSGASAIIMMMACALTLMLQARRRG